MQWPLPRQNQAWVLEEVLLYLSTQQLYVFDHHAADGDGAVEALAIVILKSDHGFC